MSEGHISDAHLREIIEDPMTVDPELALQMERDLAETLEYFRLLALKEASSADTIEARLDDTNEFLDPDKAAEDDIAETMMVDAEEV